MPFRFPRLSALLAVAVLAIGTGAARADGVSVGVTPGTLTVAPGDTFDVQVAVTQAGGAFNGFDATVAFDPAALGFVPQAQAAQEGALLRGACGNTFYMATANVDSVNVSDTMLCNGVFVTGPGTLFNLRFVASGPPGVTYLRLRRAVFYDDGLYVLPVQRTDALVAVGVTLGVPPAAPAPGRVRIVAAPNPARGPCGLRIEGAAEGAHRILVFDAAGRRVRGIDVSGASAAWDGRDDAGRLVPPGVYRAVLAGAPAAPRATLVRLP